MLNLVQLQERLKDVPMQALMQYANGANPQIPPFLALGELNRRKKMQEGAAAEQAQAMEGAPSIKEQIEQSAGLLALQGNRQRQAAQQQQGLQANMPMAAPNTTTSEPAQLAGGGFIEDIVVPRDYQSGGMAMNPEMIKKLMMLKAMKQRRPGIAGLQTPPDMFKRSDFAGGGIVAFSGKGDSFVETSPGFYQLEEEVKPAEGQAPTSGKEVLLEALRRSRQKKSLIDLLKEAGALTPPDTGKEEEAALEEQKRKLAESDTVTRRILALNPYRLGQSMSEYETKRETAQSDINKSIAKIKDLRAKAAYDAARGNVEKAQAEENAAIKEEADIGAKIGRTEYEETLGETSRAGRTTDWVRRYNAYLPSVMRRLGITDPEDPQVKSTTARLVDESIGLAREKVDVAGSQAATAASREATQDYEVAAKTVDNRFLIDQAIRKERTRIFKEKGAAGVEEYRQQLIEDEVKRMRNRNPTSTPAPAPRSTGTTPTPAVSSGPVRVTAPNGQIFTFKDQAAADAFKARAGIR